MKFHITASLTSLMKLIKKREQIECYCYKLIGLRAVSYLFLQYHDTLSLISRQQRNLLLSKAQHLHNKGSL